MGVIEATLLVASFFEVRGIHVPMIGRDVLPPFVMIVLIREKEEPTFTKRCSTIVLTYLNPWSKHLGIWQQANPLPP